MDARGVLLVLVPGRGALTRCEDVLPVLTAPESQAEGRDGQREQRQRLAPTTPRTCPARRRGVVTREALRRAGSGGVPGSRKSLERHGLSRLSFPRSAGRGI